MEKRFFIYKYTFPNGKVYIGQSHEGTKRYGYSCVYRGQVVYNAMKKYPDYKKEILEWCTKDEVDDRERYYIALYNSMSRDSGYNMETGGSSNKELSEQTRKKMSESRKGENNPLYGKHRSEEVRRKISEALSGENHPLYGKHHSEDTKAKMSESRKGRFAGERSPWYGKHHSEESKAKISEFHNKPCVLTDLQTGERTKYTSLKELAEENGFPYGSMYATIIKNRIYKKRYKIEYIEKK